MKFAPRFPGGGHNPLYADWQKRNPRLGAVLALFLQREDGLHILLTERHARLRQHAGEISLPGGRSGPEDCSPEATALRETWEEVGLAPEDVEVWGRLDGVYVPPSNFLVLPFVGRVLQAERLSPNDPEVQAIIELPFATLFDGQATGSFIDDGGRLIEYYGYGPYRVWGATARILNNLAEAVGQPCEDSHLV